MLFEKKREYEISENYEISESLEQIREIINDIFNKNDIDIQAIRDAEILISEDFKNEKRKRYRIIASILADDFLEALYFYDFNFYRNKIKLIFRNFNFEMIERAEIKILRYDKESLEKALKALINLE